VHWKITSLGRGEMELRDPAGGHAVRRAGVFLEFCGRWGIAKRAADLRFVSFPNAIDPSGGPYRPFAFGGGPQGAAVRAHSLLRAEWHLPRTAGDQAFRSTTPFETCSKSFGQRAVPGFFSVVDLAVAGGAGMFFRI